ncbi:MAG: MFS transporter [Candidatus Omnitrophota bacterium]
MNRKTFTILCFEGAVLSFNVAATAAIVPSVARDFGIAQFFAGRIIWLYMLPYGIAALFYGPLVRVLDAKKVELFCLFFFSLANLLAALAGNIYTLFAARFFMGIFGAAVIPLGLILIGRHIENKNRGRFVGLFFSATFIASLAGLFLSGIIHWRLIYLIPAVLGFILLFFIYYYLPSFKQDAGGLKINYLSAFKDRAVRAVFIYIFFISLFYHGVQQWLGVYFSQKFHFSQFLVSMLITLTSFSGIFGEAVGGKLSDIIGRVKTIDLGIGLMVVSVFALVFKLPLAVLALIMVIWGVGWTFNHAGLSTMLTDLPKEFLNESASLNSSVRFISGGLGAALGGIIMQRNFNAGFLAIGLLLIVLAVFAKRLLVVK